MILTDLNIDCLEEILEYLELKDLLNAADSNKRLCHASKFVFIRKYAGDYISIYPNNDKRSLQIIRIFGSLIRRMECCFRYRTVTKSYVTDYINEYCNETLSEIQFLATDKNFDCFKNPFTNVKTVYLWSCQIDEKKNCLLRLFPKMQKLTVKAVCTPLIHSETLANHFPYLEYFEYKAISADCRKDIKCVEGLKAFLKLNPQLRHLRMECGSKMDIEFLKVLGERERNLEILELYIWRGDFYDFPLNSEKIHLRNVKHFRLDPGLISGGFPFLFDQLESFELYNGRILEQSNFYDFFRKNSTIKKFKLTSYTELDYSQLAQYLPLLEEMTHGFGGLSVDAVLHVITTFKSLRYFCFMREEHFEYKQLLVRLSDNWSMQLKDNIRFSRRRYYENFIILKRKI